MKDLKSICDNRVFRRLYSRGKCFVGKTLVTYVENTKSQNVSVGITCGKKIGNAVLRNRSRRVIREAFRCLRPDISKGANLVFVARGKTPYVKSYVIMSEMKEHFRQAGILKNVEQ